MRVSDLTAVEQRVWDAFVRGEEVDLRTGDPVQDDPANAASWDAQRGVRADVLAALLLGAAGTEPGYVPALRLAGARIEGELDLDHAEVSYRISLTGCDIPGLITTHNARLRNLSLLGCRVGALDLRGAHVEGDLDLRTAGAPTGLVDLRDATVGTLHDTSQSWPAQLNIDGLRYDRLGTPLTAAERFPWLRRSGDGYTPQPFEQLARVYKTLGRENEARTVLLAKERLRHRTLPRYARAWGAVQDAAVGYGYRPMRAGTWLLALLAIGSVTFATHRPVHTSHDDNQAFNPVIFTLDQLLPVIGFGQRTAFTPTPGTQWLSYLLTAVGWLLVTTIATGVTRSVTRV